MEILKKVVEDYCWEKLTVLYLSINLYPRPSVTARPRRGHPWLTPEDARNPRGEGETPPLWDMTRPSSGEVLHGRGRGSGGDWSLGHPGKGRQRTVRETEGSGR